MSTKCAIALYQNPTDKLHEFASLIYKASDGYPEGEHGMLNLLLPFLTWFNIRQGNDVEYCTPNIAFLIKQRSWLKAREKFDDGAWNSQKANSFEASEAFEYATLDCATGRNEFFHGDEKFIYRIDIPKKQILIYEPLGCFWNVESNWTDVEDCVSLLYRVPFLKRIPKGGFTLEVLARYQTRGNAHGRDS